MPRTKSQSPRTIREARNAADMAMSEVRDAMLGFLPARLVPSVATLSRMETGATNKIGVALDGPIARAGFQVLDRIGVGGLDGWPVEAVAVEL